ncbi:MAG: nucleotidyltransferase domain-containing protein [Candidatus Bathyarchaeia archaeon]
MSVDGAVRSLLDRFGDKVVAVSLFGSSARGEAGEKSDIDVFIVVRDIPWGLGRRRELYDAVYRGLSGGVDVTVIDVDGGELLNKDLEVTPLLLNIAWDSRILYDPEGRLSRLFMEVRKAVEREGLERYRTPDGKYGWKRRPNPP